MGMQRGERCTGRLALVARALHCAPSASVEPPVEIVGAGEREAREAAAQHSAGPGARTGMAELAYNNWSGENRGITALPLLGASRNDLLPAVQPGPEGLSDDEVRGFCARGFIVVAPKKSAAHHAANFAEFERNKGSYGGSNQGYYGLQMEGLKAIYDDEAVQSTLCSLLGPGCVMHQHNGTHRNGPGATNQSWHKDPYFHEIAVRHKHAFRICMALYYPQRTTLDMGPTGLIPGRHSHTYVSSTDCMQAREVDQPLTVEAGSVVVIHGDTWHRAMVNYSDDLTRYMLKFYFVRVEEPYMSQSGPSWDHTPGDEAWRPVDGVGQDDDAAEATWRWLLGKTPVEPAVAGSANAPLALLAEDNDSPTEKQRVDAIFACAGAAAADRHVAEDLVQMLGSPATEAAVDDVLLEAFNHSTSEFRGRKRQSKACNPSGTNPADLDLMHALAAAGAPVLPVLLQTLRSDSAEWWVRAAMASAIGSIGPGAHVAAGALTVALAEDGNIWVRRNAAEALGYALGPGVPAATALAAAAALMDALAELDDADEFNYEQSYPYHETLRQAAAVALARVVAHPAVAQAEGVAEALYGAWEVSVAHKLNTTTRWSAAVALDRLGPAAAGLFADALAAAGWAQ